MIVKLIMEAKHHKQNSITPLNEQKLNEFLEKITSDVGGAASSVLVYIGDKLGLYKAMAEFGKPISSYELAERTHTSERYVREWLANQAAGGYLTYDSNLQKYLLSPEHAAALVDENSAVYVAGFFQAIMAFFKDAQKILEVFRTGKGIPWGDHDSDLFQGTERALKPGYRTNLVSSWIPTLDSGKVEEKLKKGGAIVADIGCGHGISTVIMAKAYPNSKFIGFDNHSASIERARELAKEEGLSEDRVRFEVASATDYSTPNITENREKGAERRVGKEGYDLVAFFDCLHDMADPTGAATHAFESLKQDGTVMIVEPFANDKTEDNLNPLGRIFYAGSTMVCVPTSLAYNGPALGAQAGEKRMSEVVRAGGFKDFKRATQTAFNIVYEAKP
jgi:SAM-dependent methyltransferase